MNNVERKSNFDLMRILCIFLIIMYNYTLYDGFIYKAFCPQKFFYESTGIWGLAGVIGFIMVSSHFLYTYGSFSFQKVLRLIFETSFFSTLLTLFLIVIGILELAGDYLLKCNFSVFFRQYWFITDYVIFYLMTPFLKFFCDKLSIQHHKWLLIILYLITFIPREITYVETVSRLGIFVYIYLLTAYFIKKPDNFFQKHYKLLSVIVFGSIISLVCLFLYLDKSAPDARYLDLINKMALITSTAMGLSAICLYFIFKNLNIKYSKILSLIGSSTLGIYLIHDHAFFGNYLIDIIFRSSQVYSMSLGPLIYIVSCISILLGCTIIYLGFRFIFKKTIYMLTDKYLKPKYDALNAKYVPEHNKS